MLTWSSACTELAEAGEPLLNMKEFKAKHGHKYKELPTERKALLIAKLAAARAARRPAPLTKKKVGRAAEADVRATTNAIAALVSTLIVALVPARSR